MITAAEILRDAAKTFEERNQTYGENYRKVGAIWKILYPEGVRLETEYDHLVYHLFDWAIGKITRASAGPFPITHVDSIHDAVVYLAMVEMIMRNANEQEK